MHWWKQIRWSRLIPLICFFAALIGLPFWYFFEHAAQFAQRVDAQMTAVENRGMHHLLVSLAIIFTVMIGFGLAVAYAKWTPFDSSRKIKLYWLYITLGVLIAFLIFQFGTIFIFPNALGRQINEHHPIYRLALARSCLTIVLLIVGILIYLVKYHSKFLYGLAEVVASVISNVAIIGGLDLTGFPRPHLKFAELVALGALAYLFSKGIGDMVEGVEDIKKKRAETEPASAAAL